MKHVKENRDAIAKVREQASHARWEASKWDRELFDEDKGDVNVNVLNIAQWHIDALRHRIVEASRPLGPLLDTAKMSSGWKRSATSNTADDPQSSE